MSNRKKGNFNVRGKVLFVFLLGCLAIVGAWFTSKNAFEEVLFSVENISKPNEKLVLVSRVSRQIMQLDQSQRIHAFRSSSNAVRSFQQESKLIDTRLDTLKNLYAYDNNQVKRIDSIKTLLSEREKLFASYIRVRDRLVDNDEFSVQLQSIGSLVQDQAQDTLQSVVTTEKRNQTTTVTDEGPVDSRSWIQRTLGFGRKPQQESRIQKTIQEDINVLVDSINTDKKDSILKVIELTLKQLEEQQKEQSTNFINREIELAIAGNVLVNNMLTILQAVEQEGEAERIRENQQANVYINASLEQLNLILIAFLIVTAIMVFTILVDIRKANKYRKELETAKDEAEYHSAAKQRFLSNMSHELRTPLQSIIGYAEQAKGAAFATPQQIDVIYRSSEHLLQIVNEVLDYNRINSGKFNFESKAFNLNRLIDEVTESMEVQAQQKGIHFSCDKQFDKDKDFIGDPFRIKQILYNLVSNAIKFTYSGTVKVYARIYLDGEHQKLILQIEDTGKGIPQEDLSRIFNEFEQAGNSNSGIHFGSGLGLSIVKTLCEGMGGNIQVKSKVGQGTVFTTTIPLQTADESLTSTATSDHLIAASEFEGLVWIVDDDQFILNLCGSILKKHAIAHQLFSSPDDLLDHHFSPRPSHIVMDMRMPGKTGTELLRELQKRITVERIEKKISMSAFTAQALPEEQESILAQGFDHVLVKPVRESDLLQLLGISSDSTVQKPIADRQVSENLPFSMEKLRHFAMGDAQQMMNILQLYIEDTQQDLNELQDVLRQQDNERAGFIFHRLAGRTGQLGHEPLCIKLRKLEIDFRSPGPANQEEIAAIVASLKDLIEKIKVVLEAAHV